MLSKKQIKEVEQVKDDINLLRDHQQTTSPLDEHDSSFCGCDDCQRAIQNLSSAPNDLVKIFQDRGKS